MANEGQIIPAFSKPSEAPGHIPFKIICADWQTRLGNFCRTVGFFEQFFPVKALCPAAHPGLKRS